MVDVVSVGSMEQLSFTISSSIVIHLLFSHHVRLVKNRVLYSFNPKNIHSRKSSMELDLDILILGGTWDELYGQYFSAK